MSDEAPTSPSNHLAFAPPAGFNIERVFPIRNLVATNPVPVRGENGISSYQTSASEVFSAHGQNELTSKLETSVDSKSEGIDKNPESIFLPPPWPEIPPLNVIRSIPSSDLDGESDCLGVGGGGTSDRVLMVPATNGPPGISHGIIAGNVTRRFYRCEDEPIHTPGAIQQFGALVAVRYNTNNELQVRIASENSLKLLEHTPDQLFGLRSFLDIFEIESREEIRSRIKHVLHKVSKITEEVGATKLEIIKTALNAPSGVQKGLWCAISVSASAKDLVICEFEEYTPYFYLGDGYLETTLPQTPVCTVGIDVDLEELRKSTTRESQPLRVLEIARLRKEGDVPSIDIFGAMTDAQSQFADCVSVQQVMDIVVGIISELTGFHRVMFYRFDSNKNGCVDAEYVDPKASGDLFRGLHYPASDIPRQARELYKLNRIRLLHDRDAETARLVCRDVADAKVPLDLSHAYLRALSPIHLKYLGNMGVRSSMSISIVIHGELWGLVACHSYGDTGIRVTLPTRELCRNIGECAATNIERLVMWERVKSRRTPKKSPPPHNPAGFIAASSADLLKVFDADFGLLSIQDEARTIGKLEPYREALAILAHLQQLRFTSIYSSQNVNVDFPNIKYPPGIHKISGVMIIPLSSTGGDFLVFFRKGELQHIRWAGNPYHKITRTGTEYLEPRMSFARWTEQIVGQSVEWTVDQMETATVLSLLYGRFIEIWRQRESAGNNNRMTRLLLQNSSHEVRTPLNAIVNYLEIALENQLDDNTREILDKAHKASRSLIYVIDDLLNLTKVEDAPFISQGEVFDLGATVSEVIAAFRKEAIRKGLDLTVSTHQGIPHMVKGDSARLRQVLSNVTSNAFQHSIAGGIKVDIRPISNHDDISVIEITIQDDGIGMSESQLDDLFQEFEQVIDHDNHLASNNSTSTPSGGSNDERGRSSSLGVGLAVVARYVRNMKGQIRVQSEPGKGTIFGIELPFENVQARDESRLPLPLSEDNLPIPKAMSDATPTPFKTPETPSVEKGRPLSMVIPIPEIDEPGSPNSLASSPLSIRQYAGAESSRLGYPFPRVDSFTGDLKKESLSVLIAEDNPINSRILVRRLIKVGHAVEATADGQECHDYFRSAPEGIDVVLMDIQMPLVDGTKSTQMIRAYEKTDGEMRMTRQRVPIIAVSASLIEEKRFDYIDAGFDGWLLKPIDFGRLDFLLQGINAPELKSQALYSPGQWERGGWFLL